MSEALLAGPHGIEEALEELVQHLARDAAERDRAGGHAAAAREAVRASGLLDLSVPQAQGGRGLPWLEVLRSVRRIAQVDSALAHLYAFHHLQVATVLLYGSAAQHQAWLAPTVAERLFWGNALNPRDQRASATEAAGQGYVVHGAKGYSSGSVGADRLTFSAWHAPTKSLLIGALPTDREGVSVQADWDAFGQRQTDSGTVHFDQVAIAAEDVLVRPGSTPTPRATLRAQIAQLVLVNLYAGIARGALEQGLRHTRASARAHFGSGVAQAVDDPYTQLRYGELRVLVRPAELLADEAARQLDAALAQGEALRAEGRGAVALAVAEAKVLAHRAALEVSSRFFEQAGASATSTRLGLDRFWRNARVHTLHDPIDHKLRDLGRHALTGRWPEPTAYS